MNQATPRILTGTELRGLSVRSNARGALRTGIHLLMLLAAGWLVAASGAWTLLPAMLLLGIAQAALFAPIHETMHMTAFASRRANAVVGWLAACPSLLNWHFYTAFHLAHHRHTQDPDRDPELTTCPPETLNAYLWRVCALPYWHARLSVLGCALASMLLVGWWAPLLFWVGPQILGQPFLRLYLLTEHTLCTQDANGLTNTRTTLTNGLMRLVMWNMSYHTEHHLYPSIPFHRLPEAHLAIRDRLGVVQEGYARWHAAFVRDLRA
jgi:fatty acid desaturase